MSAIEWAAALLVLVSVYLSTREHIWAWPTAILAVTLYAIVFWQTRVYAQVGLQAFFFTISVYGWYHWLYGGEGKTQLRVSRTGPRVAVLAVATWVVGTGVLWWLLVRFTAAPSLPLVDAALSVASLIAQWMLSRKLLENWLIWIAADVCYVAFFLALGLVPTAVLYVILTGIATKGYFDWRKSMAR